ncbi:MAG: NAD+ synthase [Deltaproteobacteria bacterium]|nr:NAD+ synthase [Deltaproteobacteria bacterium]MBI3077311.1 NAD+ synthase [Deltaproteobacteria bacterium]
MRTLRIAMAQINPTVGDFRGNVRLILDRIAEARQAGADLVTFPELCISGYPPEDLLLKPRFGQANLDALQEVARGARGITAIVGFVDREDDIYNAAALIHDGEIAGRYHKHYLPNYGVFDEDRYFRAGREHLVFVLRGTTIGLSICEDIWYPGGPPWVQSLAGGAEVILNISSSPYHAGKKRHREELLATRARDSAAIVAYNNLVGAQDELVFDGNGMIFDQEGCLLTQGRQFVQELILADLDVEAVFNTRLHDPRRRKETNTIHEPVRKLVLPDLPEPARPSLPPREVRVLDPVEEVYEALVLGTRDYVRKNGFEKVVIGLSGGIDSSLTAAIAVDALGAEHVAGVLMPSQFSSPSSRRDARRLARSLGIRCLTLPIRGVFQAYRRALSREFAGLKEDVTEENLQARIRGNFLMALSNKYGWLVLTTGNKSEMSTGYCTLYGDMAGGFAVIKDVPKMLVYRLAEHRNRRAGREVIPKSVLTKEPSAELRPNQRDADSLPVYPVLDPIMQAYVERDMSFEEIVAQGHDPETVRQVIRLVDRNEYKRRQGPPGIKITPRAFGKDWRLPITNRFREI